MTLVELVISISLFIIITIFAAYLVFYQFWVYNAQNTEITIMNDARGALSTIDDYIREANVVLSSYSSYTTGNQTLVLQINAIDSSNQIIQGVYDIVVCYLSENSLILQLFPGAGSSRSAVTKTLARNVQTENFSFTYDNGDYSLVKEITINLPISQTFHGFENNTKSISLSSKANIRNH